MITKLAAPEDAKLIPTSYSFLAPARLRIRDASGVETLVGYGIGEKIQVLEPDIQLLVCSHEEHDEIPLTNGVFIIEWPENLSVVNAL